MKIVILAGGSGTRLWPRSRAGRPKQFLDIAVPGKTLLQETVERIAPLVSMEDILVVTSRAFARQVHAQLPLLPRANILAEPCGRGSGPAIGWAAVTIVQRWGHDVMVSLHSDHHVADAHALREGLLAAEEIARQGRLVTLGVKPTHPHTGYGHVQRGPLLAEARGLPAYDILRFVEKPDLATATAYTASGEYYWNTGMFVWQTKTILEEMAAYMPQLSATLATIEALPATRAAKRTFTQVWEGLPVQQIDYGVMEHTQRGAVIPVAMGWSDVGHWESLAEIRQTGADGNIVAGKFEGIDTRNSIIVGTGKRLIAAIGLKDMVIVETDDAVLVCPRCRSQEVRRLVEHLRAVGKDRYL